MSVTNTGVIERKSGAALWRQIGERVASEIADGKLPAGSQLPTEPELASRFGVSRNTVRRAMSMLEDGGLVRIEQGRGTFVHDTGLVSYEISKRTRFSQNLQRQGRDPGHEFFRVEEAPASDEVAEMLNIAPGDPVVVIAGLSKADNVVLSVSEFYYPAIRFPGLAEKRRKAKSTTAVLEEYGVCDYTRLVTWVSARPPTDEEARMLQLPRSRWVLCTRKVDVDPKGQPICFSDARWAGDRVQFVVDNSDVKDFS